MASTTSDQRHGHDHHCGDGHDHVEPAECLVGMVRCLSSSICSCLRLFGCGKDLADIVESFLGLREPELGLRQLLCGIHHRLTVAGMPKTVLGQRRINRLKPHCRGKDLRRAQFGRPADAAIRSWRSGAPAKLAPASTLT